MPRPEPLDLVLILIVALLIFGANRLPEMARAMGQAIRKFRDAVTGKDNEPPAENNHDHST
ncbi:MAG: twin-arginine translocase TatA/TatE family subunit [Chloroflexi bacterium]|nr:twin-arginine translocase TatA/TatE family subunit [Chloroflexota bacterium]